MIPNNSNEAILSQDGVREFAVRYFC